MECAGGLLVDKDRRNGLMVNANTGPDTTVVIILYFWRKRMTFCFSKRWTRMSDNLYRKMCPFIHSTHLRRGHGPSRNYNTDGLFFPFKIDCRDICGGRHRLYSI
jgi:hypothetical protein